MTGYVRSATLGDALVAAVASLEVQVRCPVVGEVIGKLAGGAGGVLGDVVGGHGDVEGVAADNLVDMRRGDLAGVDEGVDPVDDDLSAPEPKHGHAVGATALGGRLGERREGEERRLCSPPHFGDLTAGRSRERGLVGLSGYDAKGRRRVQTTVVG